MYQKGKFKSEIISRPLDDNSSTKNQSELKRQKCINEHSLNNIHALPKQVEVAKRLSARPDLQTFGVQNLIQNIKHHNLDSEKPAN